MKSYAQKVNNDSLRNVNDFRKRPSIYPPNKMDRSPQEIRSRTRMKESRSRSPPPVHQNYQEHVDRREEKRDWYQNKGKQISRPTFRGAEGIDFTRDELKKITVTTLIRNTSSPPFRKEVPSSPRYSDRRLPNETSPGRDKRLGPERGRVSGGGRTESPPHYRGVHSPPRGREPMPRSPPTCRDREPLPISSTSSSTRGGFPPSNNRPPYLVETSTSDHVRRQPPVDASDRAVWGSNAYFGQSRNSPVRRSRSPIRRIPDRRSSPENDRFRSLRPQIHPFDDTHRQAPTWQQSGDRKQYSGGDYDRPPPRRDEKHFPPSASAPAYREDITDWSHYRDGRPRSAERKQNMPHHTSRELGNRERPSGNRTGRNDDRERNNTRDIRSREAGGDMRFKILDERERPSEPHNKSVERAFGTPAMERRNLRGRLRSRSPTGGPNVQQQRFRGGVVGDQRRRGIGGDDHRRVNRSPPSMHRPPNAFGSRPPLSNSNEYRRPYV